MSKTSIRNILLVEDNPGDARLLREMFSEHGVGNNNLTHVTSISELEKHVAAHAVDVILLDLGLPDAQGLDAIQRTRAVAPGVPLVVLTGLDDEAFAEQALQEGAQDYLIKGQTETRGLMRALRYAIKRKRLDQLKNDFISTVSHELRTPLTSIAGSLGLLIAKAADDPPVAKGRLLEIAHTNSQRLVRLVNDILDIGKMESGKVAFDLRRVEMRALVEQAIEANHGFSDSHGVRMRLDESGSVGSVRADTDRLMQVVTNLLSNAIKFSPRDNEVVVAIKDEGDLVRLTVRDHGPGIPSDFTAHVFEKFSQADTTNRPQQGSTGLGLSIVKQIVDRLGGVVGFADAPGGGTIFYVELPCWGTAANVAIDRRAQPGTMRILLCEDDVDTAIALRRQLSKGGFATDFCYTAADAVACAAAGQYAAILVDLTLPDGDGVSLILRLREMPQYRDTPIVVVSVDPGRGRDDLRSSKLNVLDWLSKPVDIDRLMQSLAAPALRDVQKRSRILHISNDGVVAQALGEIGDVVSVNSIEAAHRALKAGDFDLAVFNATQAKSVVAGPVPFLRNSMGGEIPVIEFATPGGGPSLVNNVQSAPAGSCTSVEELVTIVRERLAARSQPSKEAA